MLYDIIIKENTTNLQIHDKRNEKKFKKRHTKISVYYCRH